MLGVRIINRQYVRNPEELIAPVIPDAPRPLAKRYGPNWRARPDARQLQEEFNRQQYQRQKALKAYKAYVEESNRRFWQEHSRSNPIKAGYSADRRAIGTYIGRINTPHGHLAFRGGRTLADALAKAQAYADRHKEDVIVMDQVRGGYSHGTQETEVGRAYGWEPSPYYSGPPRAHPY